MCRYANIIIKNCAYLRSLPSRERGLKSPSMSCLICSKCRSLRGSVDWNQIKIRKEFIWRSRSLRGSVDWNSLSPRRFMASRVAPFAGAWIEIFWGFSAFCSSSVAPFAGAWIEIGTFLLMSTYILRRSLRGSVDWNYDLEWKEQRQLGRSLRGSVDWNSSISLISAIYCVAPFAGAWIEIYPCNAFECSNRSLPSRERGLKYLILQEQG